MATKVKLMLTVAATLLAATFFSSCVNEVNDDRIPYAPVYVPFTTISEWNLYGVSGAGMVRRFIYTPTLREPAGYPWIERAAAGYGGVLLTQTFYGDYWVFDAACPVERDRNVRVAYNSSTLTARCPKCGSEYDVLDTQGRGPGQAVSGPAFTPRYALSRYSISFNVSGIPYATLRN